MEEFYVKNADWYRTLVKRLGEPNTEVLCSNANTNTSHIKVAARIRPRPEEDVAGGLPVSIYPDITQDGIVNIHDLHKHPRGRPTLRSFRYQVDKTFKADTTTQEIYMSMVHGLILTALGGGVGTIFAYGQTGSGKTYTICGLQQLVAETVMASKNEMQIVSVSFIELAGDRASDLLDERKSVSLLENHLGEIYWKGAIEEQARNYDEMMSLIDRATSIRTTESTSRNNSSSRSHAICRICLKDRIHSSQGCLYLVDLAGSEAARDVSSHGAERMRETREINTSLSVLKDCIRGKAEHDMRRGSGQPVLKPYLPIRRSALTKVLKHVFEDDTGSDCETVVIACLNPSLADAGASKNTLRYAEMLRGGRAAVVRRNIWDR